MAWVSPRSGHSHCGDAPAAGPRRGRPRGARPGTPEIPREGRVGRNKSFSPELRKSQRGRARVGRPERASPPVTPRRPPAPNPAPPECPNQKRKEPDPRVPSAGPASRPLGGRRAPATLPGRFVTSLVSQQARAARAPPTLARQPRRPQPRSAPRASPPSRAGPAQAVAEPPFPPSVTVRARPPPPGSPEQPGARPRWAQHSVGGGGCAMLCFLRGMAFVPFLLVTWSSAAFIISYVVAVLSGHVNPFLPYISDTGTTPPESGIFGFMINFSAFLGAATMYTRYKIVEKQNQTSYFSTPVFNLVSLVLGLVGCFGMGIVANFQELAVPVVHDGGALLAFVCGVVYTLLQSIISYKSCPQWNSLSTCHIRMVISAVSCAAVIPMIVCASLISITKLEWNPREKDYVYHVVSAICEWTVAFGFIFYFLTFIQDFQSVTLRISTEINGDI
uniref:DNA damage regulated autophagy modulator 1 n=4 Tax=Pongo TaxID=9599 RepID=A0A8I5T032_PONAB